MDSLDFYNNFYKNANLNYMTALFLRILGMLFDVQSSPTTEYIAYKCMSHMTDLAANIQLDLTKYTVKLKF